MKDASLKILSIAFFPLLILLVSHVELRTAEAQVPQRIVHMPRGEHVLTTPDSLFLLGEWELVLPVLDSLIRSQPEDAIWLYNRGIATSILDGYPAAFSWFDRAYRLENENPMFLWQLGRCHLAMGNLQDAEQLFQKALRQDRKLYECWIDFAETVYRLGDFKDALKALKHVFGQDRHYTRAYLLKAVMLDQLGDRKGAMRTLYESYRHYPDESLLREFVSFYEEQPDSVIRYGAEYLKRYPKGAAAGQIRAMLAENGYPLPNDSLSTSDGESFSVADPGTVLPLDQRLRYDVHFGFIRLGYLDIDIKRGEWRGKPTWWMRYIARTSPGIPFFSIQDTFQVHLFRDYSAMACQFQNQHENKASWYSIYDLDPKKRQLQVREIDSRGQWSWVSHPAPVPSYDTFSMVWITQQLVLRGRGDTLTSIVSNGFERTDIQVVPRSRTWKLAGRKWVDAAEVSGTLKYAGIAGLTGKYRGWFSGDQQGLPLVSYFKLFVGYTKVRLAGIEPSPVKVDIVSGYYREQAQRDKWINPPE